MENPYASPTRAIASEELRPFSWKRVVAWAAAIYGSTVLISLASGFAESLYVSPGGNIEKAIENMRLAREVVIAFVSTVFYWRSAARVRQRVLQVAATFVLSLFIRIVIAFLVFRAPAIALLDLWTFGHDLLAAALGLGLASVISKSQSGPKSPNGTT